MLFPLLGISDYVFVSVSINPLSTNPTKWSNTLKQFVGNLRVFDHFVKLALKGLTFLQTEKRIEQLNGYSRGYWDGLCDNLRDHQCKDIFKFDISTAVPEFY